MSIHHKPEKQRNPKRFYTMTLLLYAPIFFVLALIHARWYGWLAAGISFVLLLWMRSTKLWRGMWVPICFVMAFAVALGGLYVGRPEKEISLMGQIGREGIRFFVRLPVEEEVRSGQVLAEVDIWRAPEAYDFYEVTLSQSKMEILRLRENPSPYVVLQLHGGAFEMGVVDAYRAVALRYSEILRGATVATLDYRLWPEHGYPAQQDDTREAWRYLTETLGYAPEQIIVAGDSAGGNLALFLSLWLRDQGEAMPGALVCMSPWADLSNSGPSHVENATVDPTLGVMAEDYDGHPVGVFSTYGDGLDVQAPYVSPSFGDYRGFPRMLLQVSSNELLLSDSEMVAANAIAHGVDCTLTVYDNLFHVFQLSLDLVPESRAAWQEIEAFLEDFLAGK